MIVSAFPFLNELDLLEYRLRTMAPMVDLFVLMESSVTFSGIPKPLYFAENKERFKQWPIHHLIMDDRPNDTLWEREKYQRDCLVKEVAHLKPEIVIFSDCDEFVEPNVVSRFKLSNNAMMRLELDMLTFFIDRKDSLPWVQGCIMRWGKGLIPEFRGGESPVLPRAGWHFEYVGNKQLLLEKVAAVSHGPEESGKDFHARVTRGELPGLERTSAYPVEKLPLPMQEDLALLTEKGWVHNRFLAAPKGKTECSAFTIVFNGDFTLEQCIHNAMPALNRYVVVEGATQQLWPISDNGTSTDRTNDILNRLKVQYGEKLVVVRGKWRDKLEMCNAALQYLNPGLLWQLDCDEFYHADAMLRMMEFMDDHPEYTDAEFWAYHFFGGFTHHTVQVLGLWGNNPPWRRLFRWNGERWKSHTPPRLEHVERVLDRTETHCLGVSLFHYGYCWHRQVLEKVMYHGNGPEQQRRWVEFEAASSGGKPIDLVQFVGEHPVNVRDFVC